MLEGPWIALTGSKKMGNLPAKPNKRDMAFMKELLEGGKVKAVIDRYYPLSEVADALRYLEEGHAGGKVVIRWRRTTDQKWKFLPLVQLRQLHSYPLWARRNGEDLSSLMETLK